MRLSDLFIALSRAIDLTDPHIGSHNKRVAYIAGRIAHAMGLSPAGITKTVIAALLHDIGVLKDFWYQELIDFNYQGGVDTHSLLGYSLLCSSNLTKNIAPIIKYHHVAFHEKQTLQEDAAIPLEAEIINCADRLDVLLDYTTELIEQKTKAINTLLEHRGGRFNPAVVDCIRDIAQAESFWFDLQFNYIEKHINEYIFTNTLLTLEDLLELSKLFTKIIDFRSRFTATHSTSVAMVARELGELLHLSKRECIMLEIAGHLHDLGKLSIPLAILEKPGSLTAQEWRTMKRHSYFTYKILSEIDDTLIKIINEWASFHHEKLNGQGYPFHIHGDIITTGSRIITVADIFTALSEPRPYRAGFDDDAILAELKREKSHSLDENIVDLLIQHYDDFKHVRRQACSEANKNFEDFFNSCLPEEGVTLLNNTGGRR